jgi:hypothetical protein
LCATGYQKHTSSRVISFCFHRWRVWKKKCSSESSCAFTLSADAYDIKGTVMSNCSILTRVDLW